MTYQTPTGTLTSVMQMILPKSSVMQVNKKNMMNIQTEREIKTINVYESTWKIKTNLNKFTPIHFGAKKNNSSKCQRRTNTI